MFTQELCNLLEKNGRIDANSKSSLPSLKKLESKSHFWLCGDPNFDKWFEYTKL